MHKADLIALDDNAGVIYAGAVHVEMRYPEELLARLKTLRKLGIKA